MAPRMSFMGMEYFLSFNGMGDGMGRDDPTGCNKYEVKHITIIALSNPPPPIKKYISISFSY
jgi:hypothetical protein